MDVPLPVFIRVRQLHAEGVPVEKIAAELGWDPVEIASIIERLELILERRRPSS